MSKSRSTSKSRARKPAAKKSKSRSKPSASRPESKQARLIEMLKRPAGATVSEVVNVLHVGAAADQVNDLPPLPRSR